MRFKKLDDWLDWQQTLNPAKIDLGLDRVRQVYKALGLEKIAGQVISVAGTNGKGSTVACYEHWLNNAGHSVASYTSPHLLRYNERIKLNLHAVTDARLCTAFQQVDDARGDVELTYFEFGTLAAFLIIAEFQPQYAILEVGLGGRLDAVNVIDAELAHITTIGLDHQQWLGNTRELIGFEKAGILRKQGLAVCNDFDPPTSLLERLSELDCHVAQINRHYSFQDCEDGTFVWRDAYHTLTIASPLPGIHQLQNISGVLAGLSLLGRLQYCSPDDMTDSFRGVELAGRLQRVAGDLSPVILLDVGHNEDAAKALGQFLQKQKKHSRIVVLLGMLEDKDSVSFVHPLRDVVDDWWLLGLNVDRGLSANDLCKRIGALVSVSKRFDNAQNALADAMSSLGNQDILLVCGSFMTVESVLKTSIFSHR